VAFGEVGAGPALIVGGTTDERLTCPSELLVVNMIGAIILVHLKNGWLVQNGGMEYSVLMLAPET